MLLQWAVLLGPGGQAVSIHVYIHIHISIYLHIFAYLYTYMHIYLHTYTYLSIYTYMYTFIYLYKYIYISLSTYLYTSYMKTCIHIYIYTFVPTCSSMVPPGGQGGSADPQEGAHFELRKVSAFLSPRNAASASLSPTITSHTFMGAPVGCCHREGSEIQFRSVGLRGCMLCTKARRKELLCNMRGTCRRERRSDERWPRIDNDSPHFGSK